ncbi:GcrA cell cycle regulator [bacterium]|nr:GcrA cell cycle regulator [bacterium]
MSWTDERVETLKKMWAEGQSASQIAKELGGVTRNAVIGKVHRLGLSNRVGPGGAAEEEIEETPVAAAPVAPTAPRPADPVRPADPIRAADTPRTATPANNPEPVPAAPTAAAAASADQPVAAPSSATPAASAAAPAPIPSRKAIIPAGQPLPPQPSANEISPEALASVREVEKRARKLTLMELTERTCKWPIGDPATEDFWFCGLPSVAGKPYCEAHVGVAFQPMSARRDRRR